LCYACCYQKDNRHRLVQTAEIQCGIIAFQELYQQNEAYICYAEIDQEKVLTADVLQRFEEHLERLFSSILDKETPFHQTQNGENCKFCDYINICNR
jgi:CRISPR/Cas system-associated exonuclease Cas4 (RecB family)